MTVRAALPDDRDARDAVVRAEQADRDRVTAFVRCQTAFIFFATRFLIGVRKPISCSGCAMTNVAHGHVGAPIEQRVAQRLVEQVFQVSRGVDTASRSP